ncbi:MAG: hypothetical protein ACYC0F_00410 [Rhodanobacter sp.]
MIPIRVLALAALLALAPGSVPAAPSADAARADATPRPRRHFKLVNATFDSVTALALAPAGSDAFDSIDLGNPLQGGLASMIFDVPGGGCLRDFRVTFRGERTRLLPGIDVCRSDGLRLVPGQNRTH